MTFIFWFEQLLFCKVGFTTSATKAVIPTLLKRIGWDIDLVAVLLNGPATFTESELKMDWIMNSVNFQSRLRRNFSGSVNFQAVFSSDSVNVAGPLSKTATKSMSQPILYNKVDFTPYNFDAAMGLQILGCWDNKGGCWGTGPKDYPKLVCIKKLLNLQPLLMRVIIKVGNSKMFSMLVRDFP